MKHKFYLLLVLLINGLFIGCSSDDDGVTPPDDKDGVLVKVMSYNIYSGQKVYSGKKGMEAIAQDVYKRQEFNSSLAITWKLPWVKGLMAKALVAYDYTNKEWKKWRKDLSEYTYDLSLIHI